MSQIERVFIRFRGRTIGPLSPDKVKDMVRRGQVTRMHELSGDGLSWVKADEFGNFFPPAASSISAAGDMAASASAVPPGAAGADVAADALVNENATAQWYAHVNGEKEGPVSMDQMRLYCEAKILKKDSLVWRNGMDAWKPAIDVLPELYGAGKSESPDESGEQESTGEGSAISRELASRHAFILAMGICLILLGVIFLLGQLVELSQSGGPNLKSDKLAAAVHVCLGLALLVPGAMAIPAATKLKTASESSSAIDMLLAARAISQFWLVGGIAIISGTILMLLIAIAAAATNVPVMNVFF